MNSNSNIDFAIHISPEDREDLEEGEIIEDIEEGEMIEGEGEYIEQQSIGGNNFILSNSPLNRSTTSTSNTSDFAAPSTNIAAGNMTENFYNNNNNNNLTFHHPQSRREFQRQRLQPILPTPPPPVSFHPYGTNPNRIRKTGICHPRSRLQNLCVFNNNPVVIGCINFYFEDYREDDLPQYFVLANAVNYVVVSVGDDNLNWIKMLQNSISELGINELHVIGRKSIEIISRFFCKESLSTKYCHPTQIVKEKTIFLKFRCGSCKKIDCSFIKVFICLNRLINKSQPLYGLCHPGIDAPLLQ